MRCVSIEFNYFFQICLLECSFIGIQLCIFTVFILSILISNPPMCSNVCSITIVRLNSLTHSCRPDSMSWQVRSQEFAADGANLSPGEGRHLGPQSCPKSSWTSWGQTWTAGGKAPLPPGYGPVSWAITSSILAASERCWSQDI
jgi:hypothetical protein